MENEEIELLPAGLVSCLLDDIEVRILKISPKELTVRVAEKIYKTECIKVAFHRFKEGRYEELTIREYNIIEEREEEFYFTYVFSIEVEEYSKNVRKIFKDYSKYVRLKAFGEGNEFSRDMVGYPSELDYEFYNFYLEQKKDWISYVDYSNWSDNIRATIELAVTLDNDILYKEYLNKNIKPFMDDYLKANFVDNNRLFQKGIDRIYIGNEFCHNLFPELNLLVNMMDKAKEEELNITLAFTYMRDNFIEKTKDILDKVYSWCKDNNKEVEIIINDFGMIKLVEDKNNYFKLSLGVLLNKRKKDPRYIYKKGYIENTQLMGENSLNSPIYKSFLDKHKIARYEYEGCGYKISIAEGRHSLHMPFYQTNTSQYCPLNAMCTTLDRGNGKLVLGCPKYCKEYVFAYPKHLKMVGRYNSIFAFDDTLLKSEKELEHYINSGIDRLVLNFI